MFKWQRNQACPAGTPCMKFSHFYPLIGFLVPTTAIGYGIVIPGSCIAGWNEQSIGFGLALAGASIAYWQGIRLALRGQKPMGKENDASS